MRGRIPSTGCAPPRSGVESVQSCALATNVERRIRSLTSVLRVRAESVIRAPGAAPVAQVDRARPSQGEGPGSSPGRGHRAGWLRSMEVANQCYDEATLRRALILSYETGPRCRPRFFHGSLLARRKSLSTDSLSRYTDAGPDSKHRMSGPELRSGIRPVLRALLAESESVGKGVVECQSHIKKL